MSNGLRIGDAERDAATERLGEHFAAGRLTKEEFDERAAAVTTARFEDDLRPLFRDLPGSGAVSAGTARVDGGWPGAREWREWSAREWQSGAPGRRQGPPRFARRIPVFVPLFFVAVVVASVVLFSIPWLLIPLVWIALASGGPRRHRRMHGQPAAVGGGCGAAAR